MRPTIQCPECGNEAQAWNRGGYRNFCSATCRQRFNARAKVEGALIISLAKAWRKGRHAKGSSVGKDAFSEMVAILDELNQRDEAEGRTQILQHVERGLKFGTRYIDRRRTR